VIRRDGSDFGYIVPDLYVIRITVTRQYHPKTKEPLQFTTFEKCKWMRNLASVGRYGETDLQLQSIAGHDVDEKVDETQIEGFVLVDIEDEPGKESAPNSEDRGDENMFQEPEMMRYIDMEEYGSTEKCFSCEVVLKLELSTQLKSSCNHSFCDECLENQIIIPSALNGVWPKCKCDVEVSQRDCYKWEKILDELNFKLA